MDELGKERAERLPWLLPILRQHYFPWAPPNARLVANRPLYGGWENQVLLLRLTTPTSTSTSTSTSMVEPSPPEPSSPSDFRCVFRLHDTDPELQTLDSVRDELALL